MMTDVDKKLASFLKTLVPNGSGPEARITVMNALASVLGMYLAGDLAKLGRAAYKARGQEMMDQMAGVAELSAVQLRPHRRAELVGIDRPPPEFRSPPRGDGEPTEQELVLLSALAATIDTRGTTQWDLPGWPAGTIYPVEGGGFRIDLPADRSEGFHGSSWAVTYIETEQKTN